MFDARHLIELGQVPTPIYRHDHKFSSLEKLYFGDQQKKAQLAGKDNYDFSRLVSFRRLLLKLLNLCLYFFDSKRF